MHLHCCLLHASANGVSSNNEHKNTDNQFIKKRLDGEPKRVLRVCLEEFKISVPNLVGKNRTHRGANRCNPESTSSLRLPLKPAAAQHDPTPRNLIRLNMVLDPAQLRSLGQVSVTG